MAYRQVLHVVLQLANAVRERFPEPVLAQLWAAEQVRRSAEEQVGVLLVEARDIRQGGGHTYTWAELGGVLGMSAQGARQRAIRQRDGYMLGTADQGADTLSRWQDKNRD